MTITNTWLTKPERHVLFGSVPPVKGVKPTGKEEMADLQNKDEDFLFSLDAVGVASVKHPVVVISNRAPYEQATVGTFSLTTSLRQDKKGINMSRLTEVLHEYQEKDGLRLTLEQLSALAKELADRMEQEAAIVEVSFPWFFTRESPVLKKPGMMHADAHLTVSYHEEKGISVRGGLKAAVTTLCPCSKEISEYSAHNQRGYVTIEAHLDLQQLSRDWKEIFLTAAETNASSLLYPVLKRPDEKAVTERAYENPRFVEDMVRLVAADLYEEEGIIKFTVECRNEESIHLHDAVASVTFDKTK
ncbi:MULTISPECIES: GTP cyclohydrolase FolE2 [Alteribacter]|uniref:GTP cyclohydrolase FolE2 n=1 Tax=Alteribacter keqinensis TaxID=2483800 RepID=A0A3M7TN15_9BACI|nr:MULTISPECIES: GTP cyclohydrolase FolE2 [Alteribacter]MBM7095256.1 GTP cyclohydrolase I FolE2 [Alteribacter salitolerans]RNA67001.1 GTP cyclohydrolase I FolE2 [Alteribacter keqinensis]